LIEIFRKRHSLTALAPVSIFFSIFFQMFFNQNAERSGSIKKLNFFELTSSIIC
jgi:hypothetical protein